MRNDYYVYAYIDPRTNKPFYIGKGCGNRCYVHLSETFHNTENRKKYAYIQGLRNKGLEPIVEKWYENLPERMALSIEQSLIRQFGRHGLDPQGILTNIWTDGKLSLWGSDNPFFGKTHSPETMAKIIQTKRDRGVLSNNKGKKKSLGVDEKGACRWLITDPKGNQFEITNLNYFAKSIGVHPEALRKSPTLKSGKTRGGWRAEKI